MSCVRWTIVALVLVAGAAAADAVAQNLTCGLKPIPALGCRIGRCVDGVWEQVCN